MQSTRLLRRFAHFTAITLAVSCAFSGNAARAEQPAPNIATFSSPLSYQIYNILAAEMYVHQGNIGQAAVHYVAAAQQSDDPALAKRAMEVAASAQDNALSARALERWVKLQPTDAPEAQLKFAAAALGSDQFESALQAATAVKQHGDAQQKAQAARLAAKALLGLKRIPEALAELAPVVKTSEDAELKLDYARMLILGDRRAEATPFFQQLHASKPDDMDIMYTLGLLYLEQKEYALAEPLIKKLSEMPDHADDAHYFMGQIYEGQKHPNEAIEAYQNVGNSRFALEAMARAVNLLMESKGLEAARGWLYAQYKTASSDRGRVNVLLAEGQLLHDAQRYQEALALFNSADKLLPNDFEVLYARSLSREKLKDFAGTEADLRILIQQQPDNATALNALGYMLSTNTQRYAEAEGFIRQALKVRPDDAAILDSMGWVTYRMGKQVEAEGWLRKAHGLLKDPEIASHLVEVLSAQGKHDEAKLLVQEMLVKFPNDPLLIQAKGKLVGL